MGNAKSKAKKEQQQQQRTSASAPTTQPAARPTTQPQNVQAPASQAAQPVTVSGSAAQPAKKPASAFEEKYTFGKKLGSGAFSVVKEAIEKSTGKTYAVKCIKKDGMSDEDKQGLVIEIKILKELSHPHIMKLYDVYEEEKTWYLVTEYLTGGELFDRIVEKEYYNEKEARDLVRILLEAIAYCHDNNVAHRDLKPENLLLTSKEDNTSIKVVDFGFAKKVDSVGLDTACGTPGYVAPEILERKAYGCAVDIWSIGVITYILLCGYPPFHHDNHSILFKMIKAGQYKLDSPYWDDVSDEAKKFIERMLVTDPSQRSSARQLLADRWITGDARTTELKSARDELKRFNAKRKFKAAVDMVTAAQRLTKGVSQEPAPMETD